jgi:hypothetical protein
MASLFALAIAQDNMLRGKYINAQTGTTYTLALVDAGAIVTLTNGSAIALTVPTNADVAFATNSVIVLICGGAGAVAVAGDTGVTVNSANSDATLAQNDWGLLVKTGTNTWQFTVLGGAGGAGGTVNMGVCEGRLTLTSGTPVTTADVTAATTLYFTPYKGELVALFDGADWQYHTLAELSISVPATTATMYDLFLDYNGGTPQLVAVAWTNDTTRATALTTQDGVYVLTGATDHRYVGSFRTTGVSGETEDSFAKRYIWNYYNRVLRPMRVVDTTDSWSYTTATIRQARASTANQLDFVIGVAEDTVEALVKGLFTNSTATIRQAYVGLGVNDTTVFTTGQVFIADQTGNTLLGKPCSALRYIPAVGRTFISWNERGNGADAQTWFGDAGGTLLQTGITGSVWG